MKEIQGPLVFNDVHGRVMFVFKFLHNIIALFSVGET